MKILHVITDLATGGAEMALCKLLAGQDQTRFQPAVVSLLGDGPVATRLEELGISVFSIGMRRGVPTPGEVGHLVRLLRHLRPDLVQGWMYHGNLAATVASWTLTAVPVLWNVRHTPRGLSPYKRLSKWTIGCGSRLSRQPVRIIYNSAVSARRHSELGYASDRQVIIPNGFDVDRFRPCRASRSSIRHCLNLPESTLLIGMVARYHPQKDHANFCRAAARLRAQHAKVHFLLVGPGIDADNGELLDLVRQNDLSQHVHLLGERRDMADITASLDIATLSSAWGEAFPNVIGEAMACRVPCVVTDVGDSAIIVDDTGIVVPPCDSDALASGWDRLLDMGIDGRARLGALARQRVIRHYSLSAVVQQYEDLYLSVLQRSGRSRATGA